MKPSKQFNPRLKKEKYSDFMRCLIERFTRFEESRLLRPTENPDLEVAEFFWSAEFECYISYSSLYLFPNKSKSQYEGATRRLSFKLVLTDGMHFLEQG